MYVMQKYNIKLEYTIPENFVRIGRAVSENERWIKKIKKNKQVVKHNRLRCYARVPIIILKEKIFRLKKIDISAVDKVGPTKRTKEKR